MIDETGYWKKENAISHHIHSPLVDKWICDFFSYNKEKIIHDLGCGKGDYLKSLKGKGHNNLFGYEGDPITIYNDLNIIKKNLTEPITDYVKGNVICLEVGEHVPKKYQEIFIDNMTKLCDEYLIFSWAIRGQGGYGHVNELNNDEIIPIILEKGFILLENETVNLRNVPEDYCRYFKKTLFVLKKI
jgi:hypothetical protein